MSGQQQNVCCIALEIIQCADSEWHNQFRCKLQEELPTNEDVIDRCIKQWESCPHFKNFLKQIDKEKPKP